MTDGIDVLSAEHRRAITRRLAPLYIGATLQSFVLWYAVALPFLSQIGLRQTQMALLAVVLNVLLVVSSIPIGILADRWSRKVTLMCGGVMLGFASLVGAVSHGFGEYSVSMVCFGLFMATYQGGYDSVVYDTVLEETGTGEAYGYFYGRVKVAEGVALAVSSLFGGLVASAFNSRMAYFASVPLALGSVIALAYFREPTRHKRAEHLERSRLMTTLRELISRSHPRWVMATLVVVAVGVSLMSQLDQLWMLALHLPLVLYGPFNATLLACLAFGGHWAGRSGRTVSGDLRFAVAGFVAGCGLLVDNTIVVMAGQCVFLGIFTLLSISLGQRLHAATPSEVRSSTSSAVATAGTIVFVPVALAFGQLSQTIGVFSAAWIAVALAALSVVGAFGVRMSADLSL